MGQATKRGTKEQRAAMAVARNAALEEGVKAGSESAKFVKRHGPQRFATRLVSAKLMVNPVWKDK